jgi:hypothetical protein
MAAVRSEQFCFKEEITNFNNFVQENKMGTFKFIWQNVIKFYVFDEERNCTVHESMNILIVKQ